MSSIAKRTPSRRDICTASDIRSSAFQVSSSQLRIDSVNAIRAIAAGYQQPVCMLIGLQGAEPSEHPRDSDKHIVRCALPTLDAIEVEYELLQYAADTDQIVPAINRAYELSKPVALFIGAMLPKE